MPNGGWVLFGGGLGRLGLSCFICCRRLISSEVVVYVTVCPMRLLFDRMPILFLGD